MLCEYKFWHARTKRRVNLREFHRLCEEDQKINERRERMFLAVCHTIMFMAFLTVLAAPLVAPVVSDILR